MNESDARQVHDEAATLREAKDFASSLDANNRALLAYDQENDPSGFAEALANEAITWGIIGEARSSKRLLRRSRNAASEAVAVAREECSPDALALPLYELAKANARLGDFNAALQSCSEAIRIMHGTPPARHNRPAVVYEMEARLATYEYRAGDKEALPRAEEAIQRIETSDEPSDYNKAVWVSGGYMHLAEAVAGDNMERAKQYLDKAKTVVDANPKLINRKDQLERLSSRIGQR